MAELNSCPAPPLVPQSHRGVGAVVVEDGSLEPDYVEMDPFVRKGKGKAWRARVRAEGAQKGPSPPFVPACTITAGCGVVGEGARPVGVVGEGLRSIRVGGGHLPPVSQCTPPQHSPVYPDSTNRPPFIDELEFIEWKHDTRNQPEFSFFSWTREAG